MNLTEQEIKAIEEDQFIKKHLAIIRDKMMDGLIMLHIEKMWGSLEMASIQHFTDTGKINGSFHLRLKEIMNKVYNWNKEEAEKERIKSKQLIKYLEEIKSWADKADASLPIYEIFGIAVKAINEYNTKQIEP